MSYLDLPMVPAQEFTRSFCKCTRFLCSFRQACDSKASTLLVRPTHWSEPNSESGKDNPVYGEDEPIRPSYILDVPRTTSAQAYVTDETGKQSSINMDTFRTPSSLNSNVCFPLSQSRRPTTYFAAFSNVNA